jgi:hypothetical protein
LIQYAADTKDHTVSDTFVQLLRSRWCDKRFPTNKLSPNDLWKNKIPDFFKKSGIW